MSVKGFSVYSTPLHLGGNKIIGLVENTNVKISEIVFSKIWGDFPNLGGGIPPEVPRINTEGVH